MKTLLSMTTLVTLSANLMACSPDKLLGKEFPPELANPDQVKSRDGALSAYRGAVFQVRNAVGGRIDSYILTSGLLSDELQSDAIGQYPVSPHPGVLLDSRTLPEYEDVTLQPALPSNTTYNSLQRARNATREATGLLKAYAPNVSPALMGHLFALQGYTEIFLADLFCSGIPLSTLDFDGDYTVKEGSTTDDVYRHAIVLFDSALALSSDSVRFQELARVGKARALMALKRYREANDVAASVSDGYLYRLTFFNTTDKSSVNFAENETLRRLRSGNVSDVEGVNGANFRSAQDPRTPVLTTVPTAGANPYHYPARHAYTGDSAITMAGWIEARLIQAEVALSEGPGNWLTILNALRTNGTFTTRTITTPGGPQLDTVWNAGTGGVADLPPLPDPPTDAERVGQLFRERAAWLFLTGHRQGDLRRLIRQYGRTQDAVYPIGPYPGFIGQYGDAVTAPIPAEEREFNSRFTGCFNRDA